MKLIKPVNVTSDHWAIFLQVLEGHRNGQEIADRNGLTRERVRFIAKTVKGKVIKNGQVIPNYNRKMPTWQATSEIEKLVEIMQAKYIGGYHQMMRQAIIVLARETGESL